MAGWVCFACEAGRFRFGGRPGTAKQGLLMDVVHKKRFRDLLHGAGQWDKARLQSMAAPRSGSLLDAHPSQELDLHLTNARFSMEWDVGWAWSCVKNTLAYFA